jgi:hypothetical protein
MWSVLYMHTYCIDAHVILVLVFVRAGAFKNTFVLSVYIVEFMHVRCDGLVIS